MNLQPGIDNLTIYDGSGNPVIPKKVGASKGCTLANSTAYYVPLGGDHSYPADTPLASAHLQWAAAVVMTVTLEVSNFPHNDPTGQVGSDVTDWSSVAGEWVQCNPSTAVVDVTGTGNTTSAATVTTGGTNAGGAVYHVGNLGTRRARWKLVVTTGGIVRTGGYAKGPHT